jgi:hypothetical protein
MTDLKDYLTSNGPTEEEQEVYDKFLQRGNDQLLNDLPELRKRFKALKDGNAVDLKTRSVKIAIPEKYWEVFERVVEMFELRDQYGIKDKEDMVDQIQDNVAKVYRENTSLNLAEILISQFMLDTIIGFATHVARARLLEKVQEAIENNDTETLVKLINIVQKEGIDEPNDPDDDTEN